MRPILLPDAVAILRRHIACWEAARAFHKTRGAPRDIEAVFAAVIVRHLREIEREMMEATL